MSSSDLEDSWLEWFAEQPGAQYFCRIDKNYIEDGFNLYGLRAVVPNYQEALDVILDYSDQYTYDEDCSAAAELYGLIHARYIVTTRGLDAMARKYRTMDFGTCPRALCRGQAVVPAGISDERKKSEMKVFCPKCQDLYEVNGLSSFMYMDGAYFGTTFPHLFFMTYPEFDPSPANEVYIPRVFGYRIRGKEPRRILDNSSSRNKSKNDDPMNGNEKNNDNIGGLSDKSGKDKSQNNQNGNQKNSSNTVKDVSNVTGSTRTKKRKCQV